MLIYLLIDLVIIVIGYETYQKTKKDWALALLFGILVFFAGLRGAFTADYQSYADYFSKICRSVPLIRILDITSSFSMEKGFVLLCKLIGYVSKSQVFFFTVVGALTVGLYFHGFRKMSAMPVLTVLLFVGVGDYYATYNLVRQLLAVALVFWGATYFMEGKKWQPLLCVVGAVLLHRTALIVLPLSLLLQCRICKRNILLYCVVGVAGFVILPYVVCIAQIVFNAYQNYNYGMGEGTINAVIPQLGMLAFVAYSLLLGDCSFDPNEKKNRILLNAAIIATLMQVLGMRIYIVSRLAYYFKPAFWVLIPNIVVSYKSERDRRIVLVVISLLSIAYTLITLSGTGYEPYYFIFQ